MPLPASGNQINKLGKRLAATYPEISPSDADLLRRLMIVYQAALDEAKVRLSTLGLDAVTRVKTITTLVDKLRRDNRLQLLVVHDLAGARIVLDGGRLAQDAAVTMIVNEFRDGAKEPTVKDRRANPSYGYRAVHVIVSVQGVPVEIQVRTQPQDAWAQLVEKLGDLWGRGLRYGAGPDDPDAPADPRYPRGRTRRDRLDFLMKVSDTIVGVEDIQSELLMFNEEIKELPEGSEDREFIETAIVRSSEALRAATAEFRRSIEELASPMGA